MSKRWSAALVAAVALWGCGPRNIPGTNIQDTDENRNILRLVADYKTAYEAKDVDAILKLVSTRFYETNGTPDPGDDYDYKGLQQILQEQFKKVEQPALDIDVRKVEVKGEDAVVDYYFTTRFQLANAGANGGFKTASDVAQIRLHREGEDWKIVSGI